MINKKTLLFIFFSFLLKAKRIQVEFKKGALSLCYIIRIKKINNLNCPEKVFT